jgi:hypothetical protein
MKLSELKKVIELMEMSLSEDISDKARASKAVERLKKAEATFREKMYKFDDVLQGKVSKDKTNKELSKELKKQYRSNVTQFMRDALGLKKKVK